MRDSSKFHKWYSLGGNQFQCTKCGLIKTVWQTEKGKWYDVFSYAGISLKKRPDCIGDVKLMEKVIAKLQGELQFLKNQKEKLKQLKLDV